MSGNAEWRWGPAALSEWPHENSHFSAPGTELSLDFNWGCYVREVDAMWNLQDLPVVDTVFIYL